MEKKVKEPNYTISARLRTHIHQQLTHSEEGLAVTDDAIAPEKSGLANGGDRTRVKGWAPV